MEITQRVTRVEPSIARIVFEYKKGVAGGSVGSKKLLHKKAEDFSGWEWRISTTCFE